MDNKGYWHNRPDSEAMKQLKSEWPSGAEVATRERFVIAFDIGSTVEINRGDDTMLCVFESADKNKVTLKPIDEAGKPRPYLELAERVRLSDGSGEGVTAQVWDNRNGKIVLRTLPVA